MTSFKAAEAHGMSVCYGPSSTMLCKVLRLKAVGNCCHAACCPSRPVAAEILALPGPGWRIATTSQLTAGFRRQCMCNCFLEADALPTSCWARHWLNKANKCTSFLLSTRDARPFASPCTIFFGTVLKICDMCLDLCQA